MQWNCKVIKKVATPPISTSTPPFQGYPPFLAKFLLLHPQVTQFWKVLPPPFNREGGSNYACLTI